MSGCDACGLPTAGPLCAFDRRTVQLVRARRCVSCTARIQPNRLDRTEGKCDACLGRNHRSCAGTRWVLRQSAKARYALKAA